VLHIKEEVSMTLFGSLFKKKKDCAKSQKKLTKYELGIAYFEGKDVERDYEQAFVLLQDSFEAGEIESGYYLALSYFNGLGTEINEKKGFSILEKTIEETDFKREEAEELLILCYEKGIGTLKDVKKAEKLRTKWENDREIMEKLVKEMSRIILSEEQSNYNSESD
jgi:hypothetical protein